GEIVFRTDPQRGTYIMESGGKELYESWRNMPTEDVEEPKEDNTVDDAMRELEKKQEESKRELDLLDELQELKERVESKNRVVPVLNRDKDKDKDDEEIKELFRNRVISIEDRVG